MKKRPRDPSQLAKFIVDVTTGQVEDRAPTPEEQGKDPAAVSLGRKGGLKGGKAVGAPEREKAVGYCEEGGGKPLAQIVICDTLTTPG